MQRVILGRLTTHPTLFYGSLCLLGVAAALPVEAGQRIQNIACVVLLLLGRYQAPSQMQRESLSQSSHNSHVDNGSMVHLATERCSTNLRNSASVSRDKELAALHKELAALKKQLGRQIPTNDDDEMPQTT